GRTRLPAARDAGRARGVVLSSWSSCAVPPPAAFSGAVACRVAAGYSTARSSVPETDRFVQWRDKSGSGVVECLVGAGGQACRGHERHERDGAMRPWVRVDCAGWCATWMPVVAWARAATWMSAVCVRVAATWVSVVCVRVAATWVRVVCAGWCASGCRPLRGRVTCARAQRGSTSCRHREAARCGEARRVRHVHDCALELHLAPTGPTCGCGAGGPGWTGG